MNVEEYFEEHKEHPLMRQAVFLAAGSIEGGSIQVDNAKDALKMITDINMRLNQIVLDNDESKKN